MQTFLPYESFVESAKCLDNKRLNKQGVEALQILNTLTGKSQGWKNHPAVKMWKGHEYSLCRYGIVMRREWMDRNYNDTCLPKFLRWENILAHNNAYGIYKINGDPPWLGDKAFHSSHKASLLSKNFEWYSQFGWSEKPKIEYVWPV